MNTREKMVAALQQIVVPELRRLGFKGSFPHFRRIAEHVDLLTFQFDRNGGGFVIEVAQGEATGFTTSWEEHIPANELKAHDLHPNARTRLQPKEGGGTDSWFRYDGFFSSCDRVARKTLEIVARYDWNAQPKA